jgi:uncharacterized protein involved in response to NO
LARIFLHRVIALPDRDRLHTAIHVLTVGAIATTISAVMKRTTRGHAGRSLFADRVVSLIYIVVITAAITRVTGPLAEDRTMPLLIASACF